MIVNYLCQRCGHAKKLVKFNYESTYRDRHENGVRFWLVVMGFGLAGCNLFREGRWFYWEFPVFGVGVESSSCGNR